MRRTVTVNLLRESRTGDGSGGKAVARVRAATGLRATQHLRVRASSLRVEQGAHNSQGPGVLTLTTPFFKFGPPFPDIRINDWIQVGGGIVYRVLFVRVYERTLQCDCESVQ